LQLEEWAIYEESGIGKQKSFDARFRIEAATDMMEQVQELLKHPGLVGVVCPSRDMSSATVAPVVATRLAQPEGVS
jgi:hypothetical protein